MAGWPAKKNVSFLAVYPIYDNDGDPVSGAASLDTEVSIDGGTFTDATNEAAEIATNSGLYKITLTLTEMNGDVIAIITKTSTSNAKTAVNVIYTSTRQIDDLAFPATSGRSMVVDAAGLVDANTVKLGPTGSGTAQTARDVGASVLVSVGTGAGQINVASGKVPATLAAADVTGNVASDLKAITAGVDFSATMKASINTEADTAASDYGALKPTVASRTLDVTATGEAGIDWANIGSPTTVVGLSGTTVKTATDVETDTADIQSRLPAALVSGRIDASVGAMAASVMTAAALAADAGEEIADAVWDEARSGHTGAGSFGEGQASVQGNVTGSVGSVATGGITSGSFASGAITAAAIASDAIAAAKIATDAINKIADGVLSRDVDQAEGTAAIHSLLSAVLKAVSKVIDDSGTLKTYRTDGTTLHMSQALTTDANNEPIDSVAVAA